MPRLSRSCLVLVCHGSPRWIGTALFKRCMGVSCASVADVEGIARGRKRAAPRLMVVETSYVISYRVGSSLLKSLNRAPRPQLQRVHQQLGSVEALSEVRSGQRSEPSESISLAVSGKRIVCYAQG